MYKLYKIKQNSIIYVHTEKKSDYYNYKRLLLLILLGSICKKFIPHLFSIM